MLDGVSRLARFLSAADDVTWYTALRNVVDSESLAIAVVVVFSFFQGTRTSFVDLT
jgi:hypothetical protein